MNIRKLIMAGFAQYIVEHESLGPVLPGSQPASKHAGGRQPSPHQQANRRKAAKIAKTSRRKNR